ncbi:phage tail tube protein [Nitratireductor rhodophyticola]|uniref:phage tail tube protein n=1 Tax=Nitratireductor rhodophyticola TaxID=2854036 RepID=UPI003BAA6C9E
MASKATIGWDTILEAYDDASSPPGFVQLCEVFNLSPGAQEADRIDVTHFCSPDRRREYIPGLIDNGEAIFEANYIPGSPEDQLILSLLNSGDVIQWRITFPLQRGDTDRHRVTFEASVTGYERTIPVDDRMTATITLAPSGSEVWDTISAGSV